MRLVLSSERQPRDPRLHPGSARAFFTVALLSSYSLAAQNPAALSQFFEGKQVVVKMDMPGTQQGVAIYPQRPQPLDVKSYGDRMKKYGTSVRNGDTVLITKVKVKDNSVEFQLGGGGYGTAFDDTDSSVHFTPGDKSNREKDLENQLRTETDPNRRRSLQRELDDVRSRRERDDQRAQARAEDTAENKKQTIAFRRQQGGSRFNIRFNSKRDIEAATPETIMTALDKYVEFPPATFSTLASSRAAEAVPSPNSSGSSPDPVKSLKKGMTLEQVEALFGQPTETHDNSHGGMKMVSYTFQGKDELLKGDFVNGVLVQYTVSSR
jgi:hypothetical protein